MCLNRVVRNARDKEVAYLMFTSWILAGPWLLLSSSLDETLCSASLLASSGFIWRPSRDCSSFSKSLSFKLSTCRSTIQFMSQQSVIVYATKTTIQLHIKEYELCTDALTHYACHKWLIREKELTGTSNCLRSTAASALAWMDSESENSFVCWKERQNKFLTSRNSKIWQEKTKVPVLCLSD